MKSILSEIIPGGEIAYNTDIVGVSLPSSSSDNFELELSVWPDLWNFQGPKSIVLISVSGARLVEEISEEEINGYEMRNIYIDREMKRLDIYITLRIIKLSYKGYSIRKL